MGSLSGLRLAAGSCFRLCERDVSSSLRLTRSSDLKRINGFCTKPQESPGAPFPHLQQSAFTQTYGLAEKDPHMVRSLQKEDEIPETVSLEMLDAAKNKMRVKISYLMIALTVVGCIFHWLLRARSLPKDRDFNQLGPLEKKARLKEGSSYEGQNRLPKVSVLVGILKIQELCFNVPVLKRMWYEDPFHKV
uniref:Protein FAM162A n=1 Tax=Homo sapiens TaxID=9606 RepID=Q9H2P1_HUMAN|nr:DC16 [Homo sapiens]